MQKNYNTFVLFIFLAQFAWSQTPTFQALVQNTAGTQGNQIYAVAKDNNGNTFFCGSHTDALTLGALSLTAGQGGAFFGKANAQGNILWLKQGGTQSANSDKAYSITTDQAGSVYVAGAIAGFQTASFDGNSLSSTYPGFVVKYNNSGNFIWASGVSSNVYCVAIDNNNIPVINAGDQALYKLDPATGVVDMTTSGLISGNLQNSQWHNVVIDNNNNIIAQAGNKIVKFDPNFNLLWSTPVSSSLMESFRINLDANGNILGSFYALFGSVTVGTVTKSNFPNGYMYKLDAATGAPLFVDSVLIGGTASKIKEVVEENGNYYISGDGSFNTAHVLKLTTAYAVLWDKTLSNHAPLNDVELLSTDCLFAGGKHDATVVLDSYTLTLPAGTSGIDNSFITSICAGTLGITDNADVNFALKVTPNPASDIITFMNGEYYDSANAIDLTGRIFPLMVINNKADVSNLSKGMYVLHVANAHKVFTARFIKN